MIDKVFTRLRQKYFKDSDEPWHNADTSGSHLRFT